MSAFKTRIDANSKTFAANRAAMGEAVDDLRAVLAKIEEGGGEKARQKHLDRGKLLPRQRIAGLIDPDTVNHFPSELCYNVEQVIDHPCLWAVVLNFQVHGGIHIHRHGFDLATGFRPQPFKEGAYRCSTAAFSNPEDLLSIRINRHGGVAVSLEQGELIHDQSANSMPVRLSHFPLETLMVDGFDRMPVQPQQGCYMLNWHQAHQGLNPIDHARCQALSPW